ncbi:MAG: hypothetical protein WA347_08020 [Rhabdochlamydiaceae bacterium]|jgi:hypothetical protein
MRNIPKQLEKSVSACVGQPLNLNPPASLNLFKLSCFGDGFAWFKFRAPPWHIPDFSSYFGIIAQLEKFDVHSLLTTKQLRVVFVQLIAASGF